MISEQDAASVKLPTLAPLRCSVRTSAPLRCFARTSAPLRFVQ
jgi:hypothetical protein